MEQTTQSKATTEKRVEDVEETTESARDPEVQALLDEIDVLLDEIGDVEADNDDEVYEVVVLSRRQDLRDIKQFHREALAGIPTTLSPFYIAELMKMTGLGIGDCVC